MHRAHHVGHGVESLLRRLDHQVDAVADDVQLGVGDEQRDLDKGVGAQVEAGHLAVDPHQVVAHSAHSRWSAPS